MIKLSDPSNDNNIIFKFDMRLMMIEINYSYSCKDKDFI